MERELEEDPYADSEFSWLTDEPAEETELADAASEEPEKAQTMNMQTEETQTPERQRGTAVVKQQTQTRKGEENEKKGKN